MANYIKVDGANYKLQSKSTLGGIATVQMPNIASDQTYTFPSIGGQLAIEGENKLSAGVGTKPTVTDNGDGTLTVGNDGTYYLYSVATGDSVIDAYTITGGTFTPTDGVLSYLVANYNSGSPALQLITNVSLINETTTIPVLTIYRNGTELHLVDWDSLGWALVNKIHQSIVKTQRVRRESGLSLSELATRRIICSAGRVWIGAVPKDLDATDSSTDITTFYYHSSGNWTSSSITQYNNTQYDNGTDLVTLSNNRYAVNFVYRCVSDTHPDHTYVVLGQGDYTLNEAQASQPPNSLPPLVSAMGVLIGRIIVLKSAATATQIDSAFVSTFSGTGAVDHNATTGLQGGTAAEYYHLTSAEHTGLTNLYSGSGSLSIADGSLSIKGSSDATKIAKFEVDGFTTATTRTFTLPDADIVVSGSASALTSGRIPAATTGGLLTNTFLASTVSGNTATFAGAMGAARIFTLPDASITVAGSASALTSGRVPYATTGGLLTDDSGFAIIGAASVDGLRRLTFDNTGSGTNRNADIAIRTNSSNSEAVFLGVIQGASPKAYLDNRSGGPLQIQGTGNAAFTVYPTGGCHVGNSPTDPGSGVLQVQGTLKAIFTSGVGLTVSSTVASTSTTTGCATFAGGVGIAGNAYIGGSLNVGTTQTCSALVVNTTGGISTSGSINVTAASNYIKAAQGDWQFWKDATPTKAARIKFNTLVSDGLEISLYNGSAWTGAAYFDQTGKLTLPVSTGTALAVSSTQASTSTTTGCATFAGGVGIAGNAYIGGSLNVVGAYPTMRISGNKVGGNSWYWQSNDANGRFIITDETNTNTAFEILPTATGKITTSRPFEVTNTTASISTTTGCATFAGGIGVAGRVNIGAELGIYNSSAVYINGASGTARSIQSRTNESKRWEMYLAGSVAESGSDAGSPFQLQAYNDAGTAIDVPFSIVRASAGTITLGGTTNRRVAHSSTEASTSTTTGCATFAGGIGVAGGVFAGGTQHQFGLVGGTAYTSVDILAAAGYQRRLVFKSGLSSRWALGVDAVAEGGANAGSNFSIEAYDDAAAFVDSPLSLIRASGGTITLGGSTSRTLATTGGRIEKVSTITGNTTLDGTYHNVLCNSASALTVTLPAAASNSGRVYVITNINSGTVTVDANASETINGALTQALLQWQSIKILSNGTNWFIVG